MWKGRVTSQECVRAQPVECCANSAQHPATSSVQNTVTPRPGHWLLSFWSRVDAKMLGESPRETDGRESNNARMDLAGDQRMRLDPAGFKSVFLSGEWNTSPMPTRPSTLEHNKI
jgi:hypothetical protein